MPYAGGPYAGMPYGAVGTSPSGPGTAARPRGAACPVVRNGDYVRDANGDLVEGDPTQEEVAFLLATIDGTFLSPDDQPRGNSAVRMRSLTDRSEFEVRDAVMRALSTAISRGSIRNVTVTPNLYTQNGIAVNDYLVSYEPTGIING